MSSYKEQKIYLANKIKKARLDQKMSRKDLERKSNVNQYTICNIEWGRVDPLFSNIVAISKALNLNLDDLKL